jgi:hypothetical protein
LKFSNFGLGDGKRSISQLPSKNNLEFTHFTINLATIGHFGFNLSTKQGHFTLNLVNKQDGFNLNNPNIKSIELNRHVE